MDWRIDHNDILTVNGDIPDFENRENVPWNEKYPNTIEILSETKRIGKNAFNNTFCKSVFISNGVETIGENAFSGTEIKNIHIPNTVKSIESDAFVDCEDLEEATLPDYGVSIGTYAFYLCYSLRSIKIYFDDNDSGKVYGFMHRGQFSIGKFCFSDCSSLENVHIPYGIKEIGNHAFDSCYSLTSIILPEGLERIGDYAFESCRSLVEIKIPDTVNEIGEHAFANCLKLEKINIPDGINKVKRYCFYNCRSIKNIKLPNNIIRIEDGAFCNCKNLSIYLKDYLMLSDIGYKSFYGCKDFGFVHIPKNVKRIGNYAFAESYGLFGINIESDININNTIFDSCPSIEKITIGTEHIPDYLFNHLNHLEDVCFRESVKSIGAYAFSDCKNLTDVLFPKQKDIIEIKTGAFKDSPCEKLALDPCVLDTSSTTKRYSGECGNGSGNVYWHYSNDYDTLFIRGHGEMKSFYHTDWFNNPIIRPWDEYCIDDVVIMSGVLNVGEAAFFDAFSNKGRTPLIQSVKIHEGMESIDEMAFHGCGSLESISLPDGLKIIRESAFWNAGIGSINFPQSLIYIGRNAFYHCYNLKKIEIFGNVKIIRENTFEGCRNLEAIILHDGIEIIGRNAFSGCEKLKKIIFPKSIKSIGETVFEECESLEEVIFEGIYDEIEIDEDAFYGTPYQEKIDKSKSDKN